MPGHYSGTERDTSFTNPRPKLVRAKDRSKDQTYYLSAIKEAALYKALFPLQGICKQEVRELAKKYDLPTAARPESMGLCFVGERRRFSEFLGTSSKARYSRENLHVLQQHNISHLRTVP